MQENVHFQVVIAGILIAVLLLPGVRIVRPMRRGRKERLWNHRRFANPGFGRVIPGRDRMYQVTVTGQLVNANSQESISNANPNAVVDARICFNVNADIARAELNESDPPADVHDTSSSMRR